MKNHLVLFMLALALFSCKKKTTPAPVSAYDYFPMKPGNYWVYEGFSGDTSGITPNGSIDSIWVEKDTTIKGNVYFILMEYANSKVGPYDILRDSSRYLIDVYGFISFSATNFTSILSHDSVGDGLAGGNPDVVNIDWQMANDVTVTTPAGAFSTVQYKGTLTYSSSFAINPKYYNAFSYARQIGLVAIHRFNAFSNPATVNEEQLVRYHLQ